GVTVKFILKDGTAKELYINNGNYLDTNGDYFELLFTPKFKDTDNATKAYGFITYVGTGSAYWAIEYVPEESEPFAVVEGIGDIEFIKIDSKPEKLPDSPICFIETEFGMLEIYGAYNFAFNGEHYLRIDGGHFYDMLGI
ncbi:MAG: hypothetical protein IJX58_04955, partial [Clostridia bacterium]|nr:hypothetical protein [Clostridia bacterium]